MFKKLALLSTLTLLAGCSTLPANYHTSPAAATPAAATPAAGASTASTASPPALSPSELASRPSAGAGVATHGVCSARLGQAQGYLRGLLATDSRLAKSCLSATPAAVCWENLASTVMQQQRGLLDLVQDSGSCPQLAFLRRSADAYFRAAGEVAQGCADTGTPRCLEGDAVQEASHRGQVLRRAIGVAP